MRGEAGGGMKRVRVRGEARGRGRRGGEGWRG